MIDTASDTREELVAEVIFQQGYDEILIQNLSILSKTRQITYNTTIYKTVNGEKDPITIRDAVGEDIWCFIIDLYGNYGVTLRSGWIEDKKGFMKLLLNVKKRYEQCMDY